jgi:hypothetical protein
MQVQSQQYAYRSICCTFTDDEVAKTLRPVIEGDERLLRLYETGLQVRFIVSQQICGIVRRLNSCARSVSATF